MPYPDTRHRLMDMLKQFGVAALYALLIYIEQRYFENDAIMGSFELASGLALAVLLISGKRYVGSVFLGAIFANAMQHSFMEAAVISSGDTLQALCGAWLLTRNAGFDRALRSLNDYLRLIFMGGCVSVGIGTLITITALLVSGFVTPETYFRELLGWWMGDMLGIILITPLILVGWQTRNDWRGAKQITETALLLGLTFLVGQIVFLGWFHAAASQLDYVAKDYWLFLCIVWVAVRSGTRGTVIALVMVAIQGLLGAYHGVGFFANDVAQTQLVNYWFYMLTLSVTGMALATYISGQKQMDEAMRRSETKFRTLYDSTSEAVTLMDAKGFFDCNSAALTMFGCATKEEFCTKHPGDISPPQQPDGTNSLLLANRYIAIAMEKGSHRFEWVCNRLDTGKTFVTDTLLSAVELDGRVVLQAVARDVTKQKQAIEEFERFFNLIPDMACIASTDGYFKKINRAWQTTLGYTEQEILSTPFLDFIHPDDIDATMREVERQLAGGEASRFSNRYRCKDGSYKLLEWDIIPPIDGTLLYGSARDVTEQRRAEEELNRFFDLVPDLVCIASADGHFLRINRAWQTTLGYTEQEVLSTPFLDFIHPDDRDATMQEVERQMAGEATIHFSNRYRCKDGSYKWLEWDATPAVDKALLFASARDITERKQIEERLWHSKERLRSYLDNISDTIWVVRANLDIAYVSSGVTRLMGILPEESIGQPSAMFIHPDDMDAIGDATQYLMEHPGEPRTVQYRVRHKDGRWIPVESTGINLLDNPAINGVLVAMRDITERKQMESAMLESSEAYHCIQSTSFDGFWFLDMGGKILEVNDRYCEQSGYSREELLNMSVPSLEVIESPAETAARIWQLTKTGQGQFESMHRRKDGSIWHVEVSVVCLASRGGRMLAFMRDITERKLAEGVLRESEERLWGIMDNTSAVIFLKDMAGRYLLVNYQYEKLFHVSNTTVQGKTDYDIFPKDVAEAFVEADRKVIQAGRSLEMEERVPQDNGIRTYISVKFPLRNISGEIYAVCGIATDITERKLSEQRLRDLSTHMLEVREEEKARIAREIHDELGGTLAALKMDAYWLSRKLPVNDETVVHIERIELMAQRVDSAVGTMRRVISDLRPSILDDLGLLSALEWQAEEFHKRTAIECRVNCIEDEANLDKHRSIALFRILQEALTNVSRHSGASIVEVKFHHGINEVILIIRDNGCGIPENHLTRSKSYGMLGMTERVEQLGGQIIFNSPQEGGFIVAVTLPLPAGKESIQ